MPTLLIRNGRTDLLKLFPKNGIVAEAGAAKGEVSSLLLQLEPQKLTLIDAWDETTLADLAAQFDGECAAGIVELKPGAWEACAQNLPRDRFDLVYVAPRPTYAGTIEALRGFFPLLKQEGFLAAHNFAPLGSQRPDSGGLNAIRDFMAESGAELIVLSGGLHPVYVLSRPGNARASELMDRAVAELAPAALIDRIEDIDYRSELWELKHGGAGVTVPRIGPRKVEAARASRDVIVHYHFFKNAGTSVDAMLRQNFGPAWRNTEGPNDVLRPNDLAGFVRANPDVVAVSSHTALFPLPEIKAVDLWPIFFLRHPLDRILSVYEFERRQGDVTEASRVAGSRPMKDYFTWRLERPSDRTIADFHVFRLSRAHAANQRLTRSEELDAAKEFLRHAPFFGIVELFDELASRLEAWLKPAFPQIALRPKHENVTNVERVSIEKRTALLRDQIGVSLFEAVVKSNDADMELYRFARELFANVSQPA